MGGMLATGALSLQGYLSRHIRSVTMLGSGCYGAGSWYSYLKPLLLAMCVLGFPGGFMSWLFSKLFVGTWAGATKVGWPIETLFYWTANTEVGVRVRACVCVVAAVARVGLWALALIYTTNDARKIATNANTTTTNQNKTKNRPRSASG
jgi:Zn-dependent protease with chaperone function